LHAYGLVIGKIVGFPEQRGRKPYWLLMLRQGNPHHPVYRVAINAPASNRTIIRKQSIRPSR
jgi:hypothetical protein